MNTQSYMNRLSLYLSAILVAALMIVGSPAMAAPDYYTVTTTANYRPVDRPGTERRVAQNDAEEQARKLIYEYVGSMRYIDGRPINDIINRDARLKAKVLEIIRNSETFDWKVNPGCACVQVWVRLDINLVRGALGQCGY